MATARVPEVCVAVATYRRPRRLALLLDALAVQTLPAEAFEVVIAVDHPDPETEALIAERAGSFPTSLRAVTRPPGSGPSAARNTAWRASEAPLIAFTDDDCEPEPAWLATMLDASRAHSGAVIQGPTSPNPRDLDELGGFGPYVRTQRIEEPNHWYQTCNIAYPRALLERLDGFDERYTASGEDVDLGWRAIGAGAEIRWEERARVLHAVDDIGLSGWLRLAGRDADSAFMFRVHPELRRRTAYARIFWKRSHFRFALALLGIALARRLPLALLLTLPYLKGLRGRAHLRGGDPLGMAPGLIAYDVVDIKTAVTGSIRHRVWML
jgi:GT2 family glycosyltransferase